jgi:hypothetical protein
MLQHDDLEPQSDRRFQPAAATALQLMADPKCWINRRVETVELLSREETRRRVSIDFTLSDEQLDGLWVEGEGVVVPISALTKERRRTWDLSDESGRAVPVLGFRHNGDLALYALLEAALDAVSRDDRAPAPDMSPLVSELRDVVFERPETAKAVYQGFRGRVDEGDPLATAVYADPLARSLLETLWGQYVLCAVLPRGGPNRRILKYSYSEDLDPGPDRARWWRRADGAGSLWDQLAERVRYPDQRDFEIPCPGAWRARSFHAEIVIPEELRFADAVLQDFNDHSDLSESEQNVNRASLYATGGVTRTQDVVAVVQIGPEPGGRTTQAALTSLVVGALLALGAASGLDADSPDATVSIVLGGAALYAGITAVLGESRLVSMIFKTTRHWLTAVTLSALAGSASLAFQYPWEHPVGLWIAGAAICGAATVRLAWSSRRSGSYTEPMSRPQDAQ